MTPTGQPFFVMELVNGLPLTKFCDELKLTPRERLELFVPICQAVQHAHQKGIVHRDLKPANILVTMIDGRPVPKVIDFGVAKATSGKLTEETMSTGFGAVVGTLEYMSPEQAGFSGEDIDTRADIYSLGVILYELLTGLRPIDAKRLKQGGADGDDPDHPGGRAVEAQHAALDGRVAAVAGGGAADRAEEADGAVARRTGLGGDEVPGEAARSALRDGQRTGPRRPAVPGRRSGRGPAAERGLPAEEVRQAEQGAGDRGESGVAGAGGGDRRHIVGIVGGEPRQDRRRSEKEKLAVEQKANAEKARDRTRDVLDAMVSEVTGDSLTTQKKISAEQKKFLESVLGYYREFAGENPDDERSRARHAQAATRVGLIEYRLGRIEESVAANRLALEGYASLAADFPAVPDYRAKTGRAATDTWGFCSPISAKVAAAEEQYRKALAIQEKLVADFPAVSGYREDLAGSHGNLGILLASLGQGDAAEEEYRKGLAIQEKLAADFPDVAEYRPDLAESHTNLGGLLLNSDRGAAAEEQYRKALAIQEKLVADFPAVPDYRSELAASHNNLGVPAPGSPTGAAAEEQLPQGPGDPGETGRQLSRRSRVPLRTGLEPHQPGNLLVDLGQRAMAEEQYRKALAIHEKLAADFPAVLRISARSWWQLLQLRQLDP